MTKEGSSKIVNLITIEAGGLMLGRAFLSHHSEYALFSSLSIYITLIAIVLRENNAAFLCHCWCLFILWWDSWYPNMSPSDKKPCRLSDTQVLGPLVRICIKIFRIYIKIFEQTLQMFSNIHTSQDFLIKQCFLRSNQSSKSVYINSLTLDLLHAWSSHLGFPNYICMSKVNRG